MASKIEVMKSNLEGVAIELDQGLRALNELVVQHQNGISSEALSIFVAQMTKSMLENVRSLYQLAD